MAVTRRSDADVLFGRRPLGEAATAAATDPTVRTVSERVFGPAGHTVQATGTRQAATPDGVPSAPAPAPAERRVVPDAYVAAVTIDRDLKRLADAEGLTPEQQEEERQQFVTLAYDLGLDPPEARRLFALMVDRRTTDPEVWEARATRWPEQSRRQLRARHGAAAERAQQRIEAFVEARPALSAYLDGGLRLHPDVTRLLDDVVAREGDERGSQGVVQPDTVKFHGISA